MSGWPTYPELKEQLTEALTCLETAEHYLFMLGSVFEEHPAQNGPLTAVVKTRLDECSTGPPSSTASSPAPGSTSHPSVIPTLKDRLVLIVVGFVILAGLSLLIRGRPAAPSFARRSPAPGSVQLRQDLDAEFL
jgi:hypothetical protein